MIPCTVSKWIMMSAYVIYANQSDRWSCQYTCIDWGSIIHYTCSVCGTFTFIKRLISDQIFVEGCIWNIWFILWEARSFFKVNGKWGKIRHNNCGQESPSDSQIQTHWGKIPLAQGKHRNMIWDWAHGVKESESGYLHRETSRGGGFLGFVSCYVYGETLLVIIRKVRNHCNMWKEQAFRWEGV